MGPRLGTEIGRSARDVIDKELDVAAWVEARQSYTNNFNSNAVGDSPRSALWASLTSRHVQGMRPECRRLSPPHPLGTGDMGS